MATEQCSKCAGPFGPSDIPTGRTAINVAGGDQTFTVTHRGIDFLTAGNVVVIYANADSEEQTVAGAIGSRWSGHIKGIKQTGTTATGYALK